MSKPLTVLILAAGYGRRMGQFSRMIPKALVPYDNKPLISHIMSKFDTGTKFVIACGHLGQLIKDYVSEVHKDKNVVFVDIDNYAEGHTGPATTIQMCADHIRGGFMWLSCDTLFDFDYKANLDHSWIGVHPVDSAIAQDYCWIERDGEKITAVHDKKTSKQAVDAFIGLMYAADDTYLDNLIARTAKETPQGFAGMDLRAHSVQSWQDFGTYEKWEELSNELFDVSFPKPDELFYHDNQQIIKFWTNAKHADLRVQRAHANPGCMPAHVRKSGNFLIHDFAAGDIVYNQCTPTLYADMLTWCKNNLWITAPPAEYSDIDHLNICRKFYYDKTMERVEMFRAKYPNWSEPVEVNRVTVKPIDYYLGQIDWSYLYTETVWKFVHGDLHFDNTIYDPVTGRFTAIDWRTDFGGELYGDQYYDLAKMLGGLHLNYKNIKHEHYSYLEADDRVQIGVPSVQQVEDYEKILREWTLAQGLEWNKVKLLVPIIYLNMSPLHEAPFDKFLVALAQLHFSRVL